MELIDSHLKAWKGGPAAFPNRQSELGYRISSSKHWQQMSHPQGNIESAMSLKSTGEAIQTEPSSQETSCKVEIAVKRPCHHRATGSVQQSMKTNAVRVLDQLGIPYQLLTYDVDPDDLAAENTAAKVGIPADQLFKTLVIRGDRTGICLAVIPANMHLDLKAIAKLTQNRKVEPVPLKEVQPLTGYIRGGVTALACKKDYPVYVEETIELFAEIAVSGGMRGLLIQLAPADYLQAVRGTVGAIAQFKVEQQ
jgi:Cys-tRNA(Pro)/Cys-tRNA(Cys) deacylase